MRFGCKSLRLLTALIGAVLVGLSAFADDAGVLYWMVDDPTIVAPDGATHTIGSYSSPTVKNDQGTAAQINAVRVAAYGGGETIFLDLADASGDFSYGNITFVDADFDYKAGPMWADLSALASVGTDYASFSFAIELGYLNDDFTEFSVLAVSESATYAELQKFISVNPADFPVDMAWNPTPYAVPEPSGALLMLIGAALMALRRKEVRA